MNTNALNDEWLKRISLARSNLLVVGGTVLRECIVGTQLKNFLNEPAPVIVRERRYFEAGDAGGLALKAADLGCSVQLLTYLGTDEHAIRLSRILVEGNIQLNGITLEEIDTNINTRIYEAQKCIGGVDTDYQIPDDYTGLILSKFEQIFHKANAIVFYDNGDNSLEMIDEMICCAKSKNIEIKSLSIIDRPKLKLVKN